MSLKKKFLLIIGFAALFAMSCASNKIDPSILESDVFTVNNIEYVEDQLSFLDNQQVFTNLPLEKIKESFFNQYGYELSFDLYTKDDHKNFIKDSITWDRYTVDYYSNKKETESKQTVVLSYAVDSYFGYLNWTITVNLPNGKQLRYNDMDKTWSIKRNYADKNNAATVEYIVNNNIRIQQLNGENMYAYIDDNKIEGTNSFYIPAGKEVELTYSINDQGNAFVAGGVWLNQVKKFTFEKGKKYKFTYKIDRNHFLAKDWTVELFVTEVK